jgi:hypothetical protein
MAVFNLKSETNVLKSTSAKTPKIFGLHLFIAQYLGPFAVCNAVKGAFAGCFCK